MVGVVSVLRTDGRTRRGVGRENALDVEVSSSVDQPSLLHVDQESKVSQEIGTDYGLLYISNDENPRQRSSEAEVEGEGSFPYVAMGVLFTAISASLSGGRRRSAVEGGKTLTSDPVSMRKRVCVLVSRT